MKKILFILALGVFLLLIAPQFMQKERPVPAAVLEDKSLKFIKSEPLNSQSGSSTTGVKVSVNGGPKAVSTPRVTQGDKRSGDGDNDDLPQSLVPRQQRVNLYLATQVYRRRLKLLEEIVDYRLQYTDQLQKIYEAWPDSYLRFQDWTLDYQGRVMKNKAESLANMREQIVACQAKFPLKK